MTTNKQSRRFRDADTIDLSDPNTDRDDSMQAPCIDLAVVRNSDLGPSVSVLDTFSFRTEDRALILPGNSRKLLALLALREQPSTRLHVAGTLWPEASDQQAACSLRSALWRLKEVAGDALQVDNVDVGIRSNVAVDFRQSRALARRLLDSPAGASPRDTSASAVQLLSGELLPGWYDDWVLVESQEWHQLRLHALEALSTRLVAQGRCADAIQAALATVRAEPLRESAHSALIRSFIAEGNQNEAINDYRRFRDLLHAELGIDPSSQLTKLVENLHRRRTDH